MTTSAGPRARAARPTTTLTVTGREQLTPHLVRVRFSGDLAAFAQSACTDRYVKLELGDVLRTYTVRELDLDAQTLAIDFVVHGDDGVAGVWATRAEPGEVLVARGPGGAYSPDPEADWHLLAGDESALPAVAAALEALVAADPDAVARVVVEVSGPDDVLPLPQGPRMEVSWALRAEGGSLDEAVRAVEWLPGRVHVFVHGEAGAVMHGIRPYVLKERGVPRADASISGYWRRGRSEEGFREWKAELSRAEGAG
ncbi:siderophore-interacting protein [Nocardioides sp. Y6]|uniref:Siderophore-interacting protein n=1 Tax=Nocardioides malaquae TaxID=2773426 RepID=A0ABR9RPE1_9ACTN|nr:siderophore-interacting protein [Nocardioides malaquae]MBE7323440.1 siderophore-interacting protein [Nocardioides malaquae]